MSILHYWRKKPDYSGLSPENLHHRSAAALSWIKQSIAATGNQGSSHSFSPLFGWAKAYPETTGYLIETLFDYAEIRRDESLRALAFQCADWLLSQQLPNGAFPGLLAGHQQPSVFNTAQILFGLTRSIREGAANADVLSTALSRALVWLLKVQEADGLWHTAAYVEGFVPTYYTRAVWGVLYANDIVQEPGVEQAMRSALQKYAERFTEGGWMEDCGFYPGRAAVTHTIAYTIEGFLACSQILKEEAIFRKTQYSLDALLAIRQAAGFTAGAYGPKASTGRQDAWQADYSFLCLTGNAQLSIVCSRFFQITGKAVYREAARGLLAEILPYQSLRGPAGIRGGLSGSAPFWGPYLRFRYPNWGGKFLLDGFQPLLKRND